MPKKTTHSRSGGQAQRSKTKPKSFELVRPVSDESELETVEENEKISVTNVKTSEVLEDDDETYDDDDDQDDEEEKVPVKQSAPTRKAEPARKSASVATVAPVVASSNPKSAAARLAARRQAAQKSQRPTASLIVAENYSYVRKDLVFILILAVIMFTAIIVMHFVPAIGG